MTYESDSHVKSHLHRMTAKNLVKRTTAPRYPPHSPVIHCINFVRQDNKHLPTVD